MQIRPLAVLALAFAPQVGGAAPDELQALKARGTLRVGVLPRAPAIQRTASPGLADEVLAGRLAEKLGLSAEVVELEDPARPFDALLDGGVDLVAASLSEASEASPQLAFSRPLRFVTQVLVVHRPVNDRPRQEAQPGAQVAVRPFGLTPRAQQALQKLFPQAVLAPTPPGEDVSATLDRLASGELSGAVLNGDVLPQALAAQPQLQAGPTLAEKVPLRWALRAGSAKLKAAVDGFLVESALTAFKGVTYREDLPAIKKRGALRMLTRNTSTTYFLYRGEQLGFEYELMKDFATQQGLRLEVVVPEDRARLFSALDEGLGDVIAAGLVVTPERARSYLFSRPYNQVQELLVVNAANRDVQSLADMAGKAITVRQSSSYYESLQPLAEQHGIALSLAEEDEETEDLLDGVGKGELYATVASSTIFALERTYRDDVREVTPLGGTLDVGWVVRQDQPRLKAALDAYVKRVRGKYLYNVLVKKYFKNSAVSRAAARERPDETGRLSRWDDVVKRYARRYEFDWRLILAQMYQESRFEPRARSWAGAVGLMQVMPNTAKELGIEDVADPEQGIHAGVKLLARYARQFSAPEVQEKDRLRFALAAYNCGPGHVEDAVELARRLKLDHTRWFHNVEKAMLLLSKPRYARKARHGYCRCAEPVKYVSQIQTRYDSYSSLVPLQ